MKARLYYDQFRGVVLGCFEFLTGKNPVTYQSLASRTVCAVKLKILRMSNYLISLRIGIGKARVIQEKIGSLYFFAKEL